jgi:YegS/Rv2252/BmrU family lipid kinase
VIHAIINPISGAGADRTVARRRVAMVERAASERGLPAKIVLTERAGHARALAQAALDAGCATVIVWGGDGTVNETGSALMGSETALGLVPAGSGNGLAAALGVSRDASVALADAFDAPSRRIDAGLMNDRPFFNIAGVGFDAHIAALFNKRAPGSRGPWPYVRIGVLEGCRYCSGVYTVTLNTMTMRSKALLVAFANGREYGIGARIAPDARLDDGVLDAVVVEDPGRIVSRFWHARHLATGTPQLSSAVILRQVTSAVIEGQGEMPYHVDGEPATANDRIEVSIVPGALTVRTRTLAA